MAVTHERDATVKDFHADAQERAIVFRWSLERDTRAIDAVVALFESSREVEEHEFDAFARQVLSDYPAVEQIAWARRVTTPASSAPNRDSLLVEYEEGLPGAVFRRGFDLLSYSAICQRVCDDRTIPDSLAVRWTPVSVAEDDAPRLIVLAPFYGATTTGEGTRREREQLRGVVAVTLRIDRLYEDALRRLRARSIQLYLYDESAPSDRDLVFYYPPRLPDGSNTPLTKAGVLAGRIQFRTDLEIGGLLLRFVVVPASGALAARLSPMPWIVLFVGLAITGFCARYLIVADVRTNQLRATLARYRAVSETSSNAILLLDEHLRILDGNEAADRLHGYPHERTLGRSYVERFVLENARAEVEENLHRVLADGKPSRYAAGCLGRDGKERLVTWIASRMLDSRSGCLGLTLIGEDVTEGLAAKEERANLQARIGEAEKMEAIGVLAGGIAHDFNNVLAAIIGFTELAIGKVSTNASACRDLEQVLDAGNHASKLVKQILAFSRKSKSVPAPVDVQTVVDDALELVAASLPAMIKFRCNASVDPGVVMADESEIHQVVMNLCTNAYQAIGETEGTLTVSLDAVEVMSVADQRHLGLERGSYVRLRVEDTGCGMDDETKQRIFDPFFTTKPIGEGTGMGLAVVHGIVAKTGGTVRVESTRGLGSCFEVYLPSVKRRMPRPDTDSGHAAGSGQHILLVDDEPRLVEMGRQMLEALGYRVTSALGSLEALAVFRRDPGAFDLVITDQSMPDMSGVELTHAMIELRPGIPIVIATGYSKAVTAESARSLGLRGYIAKPYLLQDLEKAVRAAIGRETTLEA
jgi:PAS domain S-box-containing protein